MVAIRSMVLESNHVDDNKTQIVNYELEYGAKETELRADSIAVNICEGDNWRDKNTILDLEEVTESISAAELAEQDEFGNSESYPMQTFHSFDAHDRKAVVSAVKSVVLLRSVAASAQDQDADTDAVEAEDSILVADQPDRQSDNTTLDQFFNNGDEQQVRNARVSIFQGGETDELKYFLFYMILLIAAVGLYNLLQNRLKSLSD